MAGDDHFMPARSAYYLIPFQPAQLHPLAKLVSGLAVKVLGSGREIKLDIAIVTLAGDFSMDANYHALFKPETRCTNVETRD